MAIKPATPVTNRVGQVRNAEPLINVPCNLPSPVWNQRPWNSAETRHYVRGCSGALSRLRFLRLRLRASADLTRFFWPGFR
jgi:hypothetical protein